MIQRPKPALVIGTPVRVVPQFAPPIAVAIFVSAVFGQTPTDTARPAFDVVSIKPTQGQPLNSGFRRASPGSLNATNVTVKFLIEFAYDVRDDQISGGPAWVNSERYEVVAKSPENGGNAPNLTKLRTQSLLADRFHVVIHKESKELPIFVLTVAKNGAKGMRPSTAAANDWVTNGHHLDAQKMSMAAFAKGFLASQTGHSVIDKTGIAGDFDFSLDWISDDAPLPTGAAAQPFPSLPGALQEQLGLKLEKDKGPVNVLVIDRAEKPSDN